MTEAAEPRWLDATEREAWICLVGMMTRLPGALDEQLQRDAGLSHFDYLVLSVVSLSPGQSVRMSHVASLAYVTLSHLSRVVTRLEKRGLLARTPDPEDGRFTLAVLTAAGRSLLGTTAPGHVETVRRHVFDRLSADQVGQLRSICATVLDGLGHGGAPAFLDRPAD